MELLLENNTYNNNNNNGDILGYVALNFVELGGGGCVV